MLAGDERSVALYRAVERVVRSFGPVTLSVSKSSITFKGPRRGFAGARPTSTGAVVGYFDLMRQLPAQRRIGAGTAYGRKLFTHQYRITEGSDLDDEFVGWLREAYDVGCGAHLGS